MNAEIMDLKLIIIDVDGTLTDSGIYYDSSGKETKKFSTRDAAAFFVLKELGIKTMILTGRSSVATEKRVKELNVDYFFQNIKDKHTFLMKFMNEKELAISEIGYIGDDLNDLLAMNLAGFVACPADACKEIKSRAQYISSYMGGHGAVRDVVENLYSDRWEKVIKKIYLSGI